MIWKDLVKEYMSERDTGRSGEDKEGGIVCMGRCGGLSAVAIPLRGAPRESKT